MAAQVVQVSQDPVLVASILGAGRNKERSREVENSKWSGTLHAYLIATASLLSCDLIPGVDVFTQPLTPMPAAPTTKTPVRQPVISLEN